MKSRNNTEQNPLDKQISLSIQQIFTYSAFLITVGASIYTFFQAIPKIDDLDKSVSALKESNGRVEERIIALRDILNIEKENHFTDTLSKSKTEK